MKKLSYLYATLFLIALNSCSSDDSEELIDFTVSFSSATISTTEEDTTKEITLNFSRAATQTGTINVSFEGENTVYGTDFSTSPAGNSGTIAVPVAEGDLSATITFTKILDPIEGNTKSVTFSIDGFDVTDWSTGSVSSSTVSFSPIAALSGIIDLETGGSNMPNQVYFDFSTGVQTAVQRDTWEIALYNGTQNRIYLNASLLVSAAELSGITDLLSVTESTELTEPLELNTLDPMTFQSTPVTVNTVAELTQGLPVGYFQYGNLSENIVFTDNKEGDLDGTAFAEISTTAEDNNVYIVGLGNSIPTEAADPGSIDITGDHRGFMKVRILTDGNEYTIQYAALDETTTISEVTIPKDDTYNLTAFSLTNGESVSVEPAAEQWDVNFSGVFSYYGYQGPTLAGLTYSDYTVHNTLGGVGLYQVTTYEEVGDVVTEFDVPSYTDFARENVEESSFVYDDRAIIASGWRDAFGGVLKDDRYYVLKDAAGNYYKMMFTAYVSNEGERGNAQFTYERL
ncbi:MULTISPECIES: HmuY family protein [Flavobacteriaceae]|uniref:HmuY family protein n=1 Tax=Flavobacteriaceae TaxID=49546 RepID=UPI00149097EC|nr:MULTISPECIES: HmuY family protein [Allomuricauda]MDC6365694.1 HmuY family protein [Muricauda sp. AC10]